MHASLVVRTSATLDHSSRGGPKLSGRGSSCHRSALTADHYETVWHTNHTVSQNSVLLKRFINIYVSLLPCYRIKSYTYIIVIIIMINKFMISHIP